MKDNMPVGRIGKEDGIAFNPALRLPDTAGGAKPRLTGMRNTFFLTTLETAIPVKSCFLCAADKHLADILMDCRSNTGMGCRKLLPVICEYLLELLTSDELHSA
jgi:hypothetical protein